MAYSQYNANDYTVGWVCALPLEMAAAKGMLDAVHSNLSEQALGDHNSYVLGQVQGHNVVIACLPAGIYGPTPAATVAKDLLRTFKSIRFGLMVGISGGAPSSGHDIRLGDIVVSQPSGMTGGVIQYDRGKDGSDGFERTRSLNTPPQLMLAALSRLQADHLMGDSRIPNFLSELCNKYPKMEKGFSFQGEDDTNPVVHYGNIASGNQVIKNARTRDRLSKELKVLCFEMEAAGLMLDFPCIVIRGICNYADSHKNKAWQGYAAATAAAFAKELLSVTSPARVLQDKAIPQLCGWTSADHMLETDPISADPGCGKSVLTKALIDEELSSTDDHTVYYFFFTDNKGQNDLATALYAILHQLFGRLPHLLHHAAKAFSRNGRKLQNETDGRRKLIRLVTDFYARRVSASRSILKFLATSPGEESNADISEEINLVIRQKVQELRTDQKVRDMLEAKLLATSNRTYLWLHLVWDELQQSRRSKAALMKKIDLLPSTVEDAYECILSRISPNQREEAQIFLHIVVGARRPLTLVEMGVAFQLAIDSPNATSHQELELNTDRLKSDIRQLCGLFVFISDSRIYLIHQTAKEFLVAREGDGDGPSDLWSRSLRSGSSNEIMTRVCVQYLSFRDIRYDHVHEEQSKEKRFHCPDFPLLEYSAENWPAHFQNMNGADDGLFDLIFTLYDDQTERPLHLAALIGHFEVPQLLLKNGADVNTQGGQYDTALQAASFEGHVKTVQLLLGNGAHVNVLGGGYYGSALIAASLGGYIEIVKLLLEEGADVNAPAGAWGNALQCASDGCYIEIVTLLVENGAEFNAPADEDATEGIEEIVDVLLTKMADVDVKDDIAAEYGHDKMADVNVKDNGAAENGHDKMANVNVKDDLAARKGHDEAVKLLLTEMADVNVKDNGGQTALSLAAANGHSEAVKLLLDNGADVDAKYDIYAAANGHSEAVKLLLANGADVDAKYDHFGQTPLSWAAIKGHDEVVELLCGIVVKLLLRTGSIDSSSVDAYGRTPLSWATRKGRGAVVELLLDVHGFTASSVQATLFSAAARGQETVVNRLISRGEVDLAAEDERGITALQLAVFNDHPDVEERLVASGAPVVPDFFGLQSLFGEDITC
ncbi:ankyrin repeat protein [Plectosphaerella plurivora]|uniref:Ankyrin repeat protein n=1 Tax=Plectosphaerella plurivora TaxID=936078 RepID=A0A9P8VCV2_9PEZI|nr:ankyrin repeat protein [Plectosphaerella plurivora]